jgi:Cellulase (glycosyl hydrolase family 5)
MHAARLRTLHRFRSISGVLATIILLIAFGANPSRALADHNQTVFFEAPSQLLNPSQRDGAIAQLKALGVKALRVELRWHDVAPDANSPSRPQFEAENPASYNWGQYDALIDEAQRLKWKVLLTLTSPVPRWATSNHSDLITRPDDQAFEEFATAVGRHYGSQVSLWAIWNEPNVPGWLAPQFNANGTPASPRIYRGLFEAGYAGLTAAGLKSPKVLFGETAPFGTDEVDAGREGVEREVAPLAFLRGALCLSAAYRRSSTCGMLPIYGYAHHPYTYPAVPGPYYRPANRDDVPIGVLSRLSRALALASRAHAIPARVPIYLTEYGVQTKPNPLGVSPAQQAEDAAISERLAWENPDVAAFSQYLLRDEPSHGRFSGYRTGLESPGGAPKPAYYGFAVPLTVTKNVAAKKDASKRAAGFSLWGLVRPAPGATDVRVLVKPVGSKHYRTLQIVRTDAAGYWKLHSLVRGTAWRVSWRSPSGALYTGPPIRAF